MDQHSDGQPQIILLWFEDSLYRMFTDILALEGYCFVSARTAAEALEMCEAEGEQWIVLMDNFQVSRQAVMFAETVFAQPELHARVKIVGVAVPLVQHLIQHDKFIALPFNLESFLTPIEELFGELRAGR